MERWGAFGVAFATASFPDVVYASSIYLQALTPCLQHDTYDSHEPVIRKDKTVPGIQF